MNKEEFLKKLEKELSILNEKERQDIIDEYKDTISEKVKHGQTEEEAVKDFGDLDELVSGILEAYKINPEYNQKEEGSFTKFTEESEKLIKKGANKLADMTKDFANNIKNNDPEMNLSLVFEIIIKVFFTLLILGLLKIPFKLFTDMGFSFADTFFTPFSSIIKVIVVILFLVLYFGLSILVIISLFKQYFKKESVISDNSNEEKIKENIKLDEEKEEVKTKPEKIIIKKEGPTVGSVFMLILKVWVLIFILAPLFCIDSAFVIGLIVSIFYWIKGINLLGLTLLLFGLSSMLIWFTVLIFNLVFSKGKTTIIPFFVGLIITVFGTLFFIDMITNIEYIDKVPSSHDLETINKEYTTDKKVYIENNLNGSISKIVDENMQDNNFKINFTYSKKDLDISVLTQDNYQMYKDNCPYYDNSNSCTEIYNYFILNSSYKNGHGEIKQSYNEFINNLKDNKIYNYSKIDDVKIEIIANSKTMSLIENY